MVALNLLQQPGRTTYDARVELTERPGDFLAQAFVLWHPESNFGEFQNQAYGYLFPQGAWFVLLDAIGTPDWVSQRLWSALVLVVACEGARRVAKVIGLDGGAALVTGIVFACSPRLLGTIGVISSESLPGAVMPWVVLPVLLALRGRLPGWSAALLSGAAVACMGGVNAVENAGALPLAGILVLWGVRRRLVPARFLAQWSLMVGLASTWWALPLLLLARFSPPFYEYVESAADTTGLVGWSEAVRGDSHWVAYLIAGDRAVWPAAHFLAVDPLMLVVAGCVAAIGFVGLASLRNDLRTPLIGSAVLGLALMTLAHGGWAGSPLSGGAREALDGVLQIFRNVHKIDPVVRLPIAIGVGQAAAVAVAWLVVRRPSLADSRGALLALPACLALVLGQPFLDNNVRTEGWHDIPDAWVDARDYLAEHQADTTTLVVPGSGFARQDWGWTNDEPLLALGGVRWVTRSQVPLIPGQSIRFLSALDRLVTTGRATDGLPEQLARAGVGHVVVRRDLERSRTDSPHPGVATVSLDQPGLRLVADFGDVRDGGARVEVYAVGESSPQVRSTAVDDVVTVAGVPESVLDVQDEGLAPDGRATVLSGERDWDAIPDVVTDGNQRRERAFGSVHEAVSAVMEAAEAYRTPRRVHDYPAVPGTPQVVATYDDVAAIRASSSQAYADTFGAVTPQNGPYAAFDGDRATRWVSSPAGKPEEQWLRIEFDNPRSLDEVTVTPVVGDSAMVPVRRFVLVAGGIERSLSVNPTGSSLVADFGGRRASSLEIRVAEVGSTGGNGSVAIRDVEIGRAAPTRSLVLPDELGPESGLVLESEPSLRACSPTQGVPDCDVVRIRGSEEPSGMDRTLTTPFGLRARMQGLVVARGTASTALLLEPLDRNLTVGATSVYGADPRVSSRFVRDGDPETVWMSADDDPTPTLLLRWRTPQRITGVRIDLGDDLGGDLDQRPVRTTLRAGKVTQDLQVTGSNVAIEPVTTRTLEIAFQKADPRGHVQVSELELEGAQITVPFRPEEPTGAVCGFGPNLEIDRQTVSTRVTGTMGDLVTGRPLRFEACSEDDPDGPVAEVGLAPGTHRLRTPPTAEFHVVRLAGTPTSGRLADPDDTGAARETSVESWGSSKRTVRLTAGDASVVSVPENHNAGWTARLGDQELESVRVDGWQQGWVVPAGAAGLLTLEFAPQRTYSVVLPLGLGIAGLILVAALALLLAGSRRRAVGVLSPWPEAVSWGAPARLSAGAVTLVLLGPVAAAGLAAAVLLRQRIRTLLLVTGGLVAASAATDALADFAWQRSAADGAAALAVGLLVGLVPARPRTIHHGTAEKRKLMRTSTGAAAAVGAVWKGPQALVALGVLATMAVWRAVLLQDSFFNQDDYYLTSRALDSDLTWSFLFEPAAGHVMPAQQLTYWLVAHNFPFDWASVALLVLAAQVLSTVVMWHLLTRLLPGRWVRVPLLAAFAWSPLTLVTTLWWSAAMGLWPHLLFSLLAMLCMVRAIQGAGPRWVNLAGCLAATVAGLAWHERSVLIPPVLLALAVVMSEASGWRRITDALRRWWVLWAAYAVLLVGYLVAHAQITSVEGAGSSVRTSLAIIWSYVAENTIPGLASGPWSADLQGGAVVPRLWVTVLALILAAVVTTLLLRRGGRDARWALAFLVAYVAADLALLLSGRGGFGRIIGLDPRYSSDIVHIAVPCVALALRGAPPRFGLPESVPWGWPRLRTGVLALGTAAYLIGSVAGTATLVPHFQNPEDRSWVANVRGDLARDPEQVILDDLVPPGILLPLLGEEALLSRVLAPLPEHPQFDLPSERLRQVDAKGHLVEVALFLPAVMKPGPVANCGHAVTDEAVVAQLEREVEGRAVLRVEYFTDTDTDVELSVGEWTQEFHADPGPNVVWVVVPDQGEFDAVGARLVDDERTTLCLAGLQAGMPMRQ